MRRILDDAAAACGRGSRSPSAGDVVAAAAVRARPAHRRRAAARGGRREITLVTPEATPLELFGAEASAVVARAARGPRHRPSSAAPSRCRSPSGELGSSTAARIGADRVVALPRARRAASSTGLPHDSEGFIPVDPHGRVDGIDGVYAAGDITTFPFKQGGLATQQADAAAEAMLADLGLPIEPQPFSPVLQGVLYTGGEPAYMRAPLGDRGAAGAEPRSYSMWWPPG